MVKDVLPGKLYKTTTWYVCHVGYPDYSTADRPDIPAGELLWCVERQPLIIEGYACGPDRLWTRFINQNGASVWVFYPTTLNEGLEEVVV